MKLDFKQAVAKGRLLSSIDRAIDLADGDFPPTQGRRKRLLVFRHLNLLIDIPGLPEGVETGIAEVLDSSLEVVPSLIRALVQACYLRKKGALRQRRRRRQWSAWYDKDGTLLRAKEPDE